MANASEQDVVEVEVAAEFDLDVRVTVPFEPLRRDVPQMDGYTTYETCETSCYVTNCCGGGVPTQASGRVC